MALQYFIGGLHESELFGSGIAPRNIVPGGTLVPGDVVISSRGIVSGAVVSGGSLALEISSAGIPSGQVVPGGSLHFDSIIASLGIPPRGIVPGGTLTPGIWVISSVGIMPRGVVPGGVIGATAGLITLVGVGIAPRRIVPGGTIYVHKDPCAGPIIALPPSTASLSSAQLAEQSGLPQSLFDAVFNSVPTAQLEANAEAVANALGVVPSQLKARIALEKRRYIGRTSQTAGSTYSALKKRT